MTKANDLASLLDANGDVVSSALDNVPASDLVNDTTPQLGGTLDTNTNDINFGTNVKSNYGTSAQLMMYHDGSNGWIKGNNTGNNSIAIQSGGTGTVMISGSSGQNIISQQGDSAYLHHAGFAKLITTATGVDVTGTVTATGATITNSGLILQSASVTKSALNSAATTNQGINGTAAGDQYNWTTGGKMLWSTNSGTNAHLVLDSSGNLLVGKSATAFGTAGIEARAGGTLWATASGTNAVSFNRLSSDGAIAYFSKDGSTVGSIGSASSGSVFDISGAANDVRITGGNASYWIDTNAIYAGNDASRDLGTSSFRWKDLYLSGGVVFGATGGVVTSKTLDDYEEGTWTPSFQASVTNPTVTAQGNSLGRYVKIGNIVHFWFYDNSTNITNAGSGFASVGGLPYTNEAGYYPVFQYVHGNHFTTASAGGYVSASTNSCIFIERDTINVVNWATGTRYMMISGTYRTA